ncbi:hypothetical protein GYMLUDRAFT_781239 [Collybiopsis luxurians FD-317 M1]|uniref:Uncharacterized protein n=1 Tax=Collybiopsis luxurians FD-317 M1 TaxID=944289 RepID=A0A0D0CN56_9AGAR|nr:hypothetical protein GYMLUDRAFT_781239 [Collybiopsis luxurians FD-317 M1]
MLVAQLLGSVLCVRIRRVGLKHVPRVGIEAMEELAARYSCMAHYSSIQGSSRHSSLSSQIPHLPIPTLTILPSRRPPFRCRQRMPKAFCCPRVMLVLMELDLAERIWKSRQSLRMDLSLGCIYGLLTGGAEKVLAIESPLQDGRFSILPI